MNHLACPQCQNKNGRLETTDHRRFFVCPNCGYRDYAKIAMSKSQKKKNDDFFAIYTELINKLPNKDIKIQGKLF